MAPRPYWKGHLKLSLVSCPIALYAAIDNSERLSFRQVNRRTGSLRHQLVDMVTGDAVASSEKGRGYEVAENQFVVIEDKELERARAEAIGFPRAGGSTEEPDESQRQEKVKVTRHKGHESSPLIASPRLRISNPRSIDIERFIPHQQIDARYYHTPYYIAPRDAMAHEVFTVIREAMTAKGVVGLARVVLSNRERPILIEPLGPGLRGMTLRYAHEIRGEAEVFGDIPELVLPAEMLEVAGQIVDTKTADFDVAWLEDRYRAALVSLLQEKKAKVSTRVPRHVPTRDNVVTLMDILRRSLASAQPAAAQRKAKPSRRAMAAVARPSSAKRAKLPARSRSG